jgi:hypothetical protein
MLLSRFPPVLSKLLLALSFIQPILGFLDYKLPILHESNLKHLRLEVSGQLALDFVEGTPDRLNILYKLTDVLVQQWEHLNQLSFHVISKKSSRCTLNNKRQSYWNLQKKMKINMMVKRKMDNSRSLSLQQKLLPVPR